MFCLLIAAILTWNNVKIVKTDDEWRALLGRERYCVMRRKATEPAFSGSCSEMGLYQCAACELALFHSSAKIASIGWPSFSNPFVQNHVWIKEDYSLLFKRYEVLCRGCDSHLGHVFRQKDGTLRYTINAIALKVVLEEP